MLKREFLLSSTRVPGTCRQHPITAELELVNTQAHFLLITHGGIPEGKGRG